MSMVRDYSVYLLTDDYYLKNDNIFSVIETCLQAGVSVLQYRAKEKTSREMLRQAERLRVLTRHYNIPLIINDRLDIALAVDADGVHLGQSDLPLAVARRLMGDKHVGVSATCYEEGREAIMQGADCIGIGPVFPTATKKDAKPACGLTALVRLKSEFPEARLVAIGGITPDNAAAVLQAGAEGLAVISAILGARQPAEAVASFRKLF
ncbi:MAG TPA: thiamine phosphate synthase [Negativicutes bacterium]